ncbi:MAG: HyaD/HybD family hydrogenase maturation endopeptidase [Bacteroidales bacterium]|nr:HyaD/HybD family hydrogenase maturation endopeptidase [Bacteroidales bacterium]
METNRAPVVVIGLGNILLADDGIGVHAINKLFNEHIENVEFVEGGTLGINLLNVLEDRELVIAIDAVKGNQPPGTVYKFRYDEIYKYYANNTMSLHQLDFVKALEIGSFLDKTLPEITIIGVEPKRIELDMNLSNCVKSQLPKIIQLVKDEIHVSLENFS